MDEIDLHHSLMNNRIASCFAYDQVSPLDDDDRHEERRVARVFEHLALRVGLPNQQT